LVKEALTLAEDHGERFYEAELHRLEGELLLMQGVGDAGDAVDSEAEASFRRAINVGRKQGAKWWELRATVSLARLLHGQRRSLEARTMLAESYGWFSEGIDAADVRDARALLEELG
jgi:predicted ATPase